jgi:hypothetical protein
VQPSLSLSLNLSAVSTSPPVLNSCNYCLRTSTAANGLPLIDFTACDHPPLYNQTFPPGLYSNGRKFGCLLANTAPWPYCLQYAAELSASSLLSTFNSVNSKTIFACPTPKPAPTLPNPPGSKSKVVFLLDHLLTFLQLDSRLQSLRNACNLPGRWF